MDDRSVEGPATDVAHYVLIGCDLHLVFVIFGRLLEGPVDRGSISARKGGVSRVCLSQNL